MTWENKPRSLNIKTLLFLALANVRLIPVTVCYQMWKLKLNDLRG